jgi:ligand-binding sensor domain-containing protein
VFDLYADKNNGVWIGTWSGGVVYYSDYNYKFPHIKNIVGDNEPVTRSVISSYAEDADGNIWVGSENFGLKKFNPEKKVFIGNEQKEGQWPISRIKAITTDTYNRHWFGTLFEGLWLLENNRLRQVENDLTLSINSTVLAVDTGVWVGTRESGLIFYNTSTNTVQRFLADERKIGSISSNQIWDVFQDSKGNLWICSDFGLSVKYKNEEGFKRYFYNNNANSISRNMIYTISEDRNGKLWIGTSGGGIDIFDPESKSFDKFGLNASIKNADVYSIVKDHQENMWFSTKFPLRSKGVAWLSWLPQLVFSFYYHNYFFFPFYFIIHFLISNSSIL